MSIVDARNVWSRAMAQLEAGMLTPEAHVAARGRLEAIRDQVGLPERGRVDLYVELLEQAWGDRHGSEAEAAEEES